MSLRDEFRELGAVGLLAVFVVVAPALGALVLAGTASSWLEPLRALGSTAVPVFLAATVVLAGLSLVPTHASSLIAGLLFGATWGSVLALSGVVGAAVVGFVVVRRVVGDTVVRALARRPRAAAVHTELLQRDGRRTAGVIALVRLSPVMPFAGTNLLMAAARVKPAEFLVGSAIGLAPRVVLVAVAGAGLGELDLSRSGDVRLLVLGAAATVLVLFLIGRIARRALPS